MGYSPWSRKRVGQDLATKQQQQQIYHYLSTLPMELWVQSLGGEDLLEKVSLDLGKHLSRA